VRSEGNWFQTAAATLTTLPALTGMLQRHLDAVSLAGVGR
jgi:hypothetical protein